MKITQYIILTLALTLTACHEKNEKASAVVQAETAFLVSGEGAYASSPYFTEDPVGNPVLCWTARQNEQEAFVLKFSTFMPEKGRFGKTITVTPSVGTREHAESMNKMAFKADGTIVAVYAKKHATKAHPYAGYLYYTTSTDQGKSWTSPRFLHSDTLPTYGRSYFDLATLSDGEVGAIWLDGRFGDKDKGSALFFAKTAAKGGFGMDRQIGESTCECCRTDLFIDEAGDIHIAYRDILNGEIRDMVQQVSTDNGLTFSEPVRISRDNWQINACPHSGPTLAANKAGLQAAWFTAGGGPGVYFATSKDNGNSFGIRKKVSTTARHPQLIALNGGKTALAWDEPLREEEDRVEAMRHGHQHHQRTDEAAGSRIVLQIRDSNDAILTQPITPEGEVASNPVLTALGNKEILIAWTEKEGNKTVVKYRLVDLGN